ncbi:YiiX/YebB-like N1pC/P60 family cysteine hydrolase [Acinetobacter sp. RF15B]|nr:YiiX/YebB-like N1pC/P60 family cysteine hydrolase [Acinetobacter sp. RF15B]
MPEHAFQVGDWIVREGVGYESFLIKKLSGSEYSHIGVIAATQPKIWVVHATTDDDPSYLNQVIQSDISDFIDSKRAKKWAVYRESSLEPDKRKDIARAVARQVGEQFILGSRGETHRYCTTIIAEKLPLSLRNKLVWSKVELPGLQGELLFPDALLKLESVELIYKNR